MEEKIMEFLMGWLDHCGYYSLFLTTFLEAAALLGVFIPGESMVVLAGIAASKGVLDLKTVVWVSALGAVLGDAAGYLMGRLYGERLLLRYGRFVLIKKNRLDDVKVFFKRHGGKTVFLGRFTALLRALAPYVAGVSRMPYGRFAFYNITGGIIWAATFALAGYFLGSGWHIIKEWFSYATIACAAAALAAFALYLVIKKREAITETLARFEKRVRAWSVVRGLTGGD